MEPLLTTQQAADELCVSVRRVQQLIKAGRIKTIRAGHIYLMERRELEGVRVRVAGRPKK